MIKFFRKIRYDLLEKNKSGKYLKYAIGEIILVVIGILIALGINSWNQDRLSNQQQKVYLNNFKEELLSNSKLLQRIDKQYAKHQEETAIGITLLTEDFRVSNFLTVDSLISTRWRAFPVGGSTYEEMKNNGSFYSLHNKELKKQIDQHYITANSYASAFKEMNSNGQTIMNSKDLNSLEVLRHRLRQSPVDLKGIDTSWIHNPNSSIYQALFKRAMHCKTTNRYRRGMIKDIIQSNNDIIESIDNEVGNHD
jgi:hypothetical protein